MLGRHDHDHRHPQCSQFRRVGANGGQGQLTLAEGTVGRVLLNEVDASAGLGPQHPIADIHHGTAVSAGNGIGLSGKTQQLPHAGGRRHRQQEAATGTPLRQAIRRLQQKRHADAQLGRLGPRQQTDPFPLRQRGGLPSKRG